MKYMLLIYGDERTDDFDGSADAFEPWMKYTQEAAEAGVLEAGAGLHPTSTATTVRVRGDDVVTTDGPFAETREQLGGYYLLDCADLDEATRMTPLADGRPARSATAWKRSSGRSGPPSSPPWCGVAEARRAYEAAITRCSQPVERRHLEQRRGELI